MSLEEFKKKVNYTWNRIPKQLCRNIVNKFDSIVQAVYNNKGHKENKNNRKEKKPKRIVKFRIKDRTFNNKIFNEYEDSIERIAYNDKTFLEIKKQMRLFVNTEICFYKKILVVIGSFIKNHTSRIKGISSNMKAVDSGEGYKKRVDAIIADRNELLGRLDGISQDAFWSLINNQLKENLICNNTLTNRKMKLENIMMNAQTDEQNKEIYNILKYVRKDLEFKENEKDLKEFCHQFMELMKTKEQRNSTNQSISTKDKTILNDDFEASVDNNFKPEDCYEEELEMEEEENYEEDERWIGGNDYFGNFGS